MAVVQATSVMLANIVFLPGVLVRVACQRLAGSFSGAPVAHADFATQLGGKVAPVSDRTRWSILLFATVAGPLLLGSILLMPMIVRATLLDVRPFAPVSSDVVLSRNTSFLPIAQIFARFGPVEFLRLWFGVSCLYCCIPSTEILAGAAEENRRRARSWRFTLGPVIGVLRALRILDALLTIGFAGTYLASGLIVLLVSWRLLGFLARALF
ncbi:MAG: hypothetical protein M3321_06855 [Actinomycetota bacterium]|nr:hypothetical protein [Actinomycetota bacterium]